MTKRFYYFFLFISLFFVLAISAYAENATITGTTATRFQQIQAEKQGLLEKRKAETNFKDRKMELQEKLKVVRDEKKKVMVERIDERISAMNKNHTKRLLTVLEKLEAILNKISDRAQKLKEIPAGLNTTAVDSAIASAKTAINAAKEVIVTQSAKTYSVEITSEAKLKANVGAVVSMFRKDLRDAHKAVIDAKQSVQKAERELALIRGEERVRADEEQGIRVSPSAINQ